LRAIEGVTLAVNEKMDAVRGNVLREDGVILRTCSHDVRHPVGDIHTGSVSHENRRHACCDALCCDGWREKGEAQ
jgi:hypothetical protein